MKFIHFSKALYARLALFFGKRTPLRVTHAITNRCNLNCDFCVRPEIGNELSSIEIEPKMLLFKKLGTVAWGFTGGEPFIRNDLPRLLNFAKNKCGFMTSIVTNGTLTNNFMEVGDGDIDFLMISMEGNKEKNDKIRGVGAFDRAIATLDRAKSKKIKFISLDCVIQDNNRKEIEFILELSQYYGIYCGFQPIFNPETGRENDLILTSIERRKNLFENIKYVLSQANKNIFTSREYLAYCLNYGSQSFKKNVCFAGLLYCLMMPDGEIRNCYWKGKNNAKRIEDLDAPSSNCYCWPQCHGEYSFLFSLNIRNVLSLMKKLLF